MSAARPGARLAVVRPSVTATGRPGTGVAPDLVDVLPDGPALLHDAAGVVVAATAELAALAGVGDPRDLAGLAVDSLLLADRSPGAGRPPSARLRRPGAPALPVRLVRPPAVDDDLHVVLVAPLAGPGSALDAPTAAVGAAPVGAAAVPATSVPAPAGPRDERGARSPGAPAPRTVPRPAVPAAEPAGSVPDALDEERRRRRRAETAAREERRRLGDVALVARLGTWEVDLDADHWTLSPELRTILDGAAAGSSAPRGAVVLDGPAVVGAVHPADRAALTAGWEGLVRHGAVLDAEFRLARRPGRLFHVRALRTDRDGPAAVGTVEDVTDRRGTELALRASAQRWTDLLAVAPVGIALFDDDERLVQVNQALCRLLGTGGRDLIGRTADELLDLRAEVAASDLPDPAVAPLLARPAGSAGSISWSCGARALRRRGRGGAGADPGPVWCELHVSVTPNPDGGVTHLVVVSDVTEARRVEAHLRHLALHDELTGLPNRRALAASVSHLLHGPTARRVGVLFCDLDNFTRVNDSLGHDAGDELLVDLAARLRDRLPAGCGAVRVSGDEFAVVCADVDRHGGLDALSSTVAALLRTAVPVHGQLVRISATVGAVVAATAGVGVGARPSAGAGEAHDLTGGDPVAAVLRRPSATADVELHPATTDLMRFADAALFQAKRRGAGRFALADEAMLRGADEAIRLEGQLRQALANDELVLHFQPVVGPDGIVQTAEALVRWQHPERGLLFPDTFLPVAAGADLLGELDRWVLRAAVTEAARWPAVDGTVPSIAVNLAGLLPGDPDFLPYVRGVVGAAGLPWDRLVLELVETCLVDLPPRVRAEMTELIDAGVRFAVDDFGTGWSSLARLTGLPAQIVKLDRGFVSGVATGESDRAVARAVVELTAAIGQTCVAEGVEDADQFAVLRDLGVDAYQGWLFARAMPAAAFADLLGRGPLAPQDLAGAVG